MIIAGPTWLGDKCERRTSIVVCKKRILCKILDFAHLCQWKASILTCECDTSEVDWEILVGRLPLHHLNSITSSDGEQLCVC